MRTITPRPIQSLLTSILASSFICLGLSTPLYGGELKIESDKIIYTKWGWNNETNAYDVTAKNIGPSPIYAGYTWVLGEEDFDVVAFTPMPYLLEVGEQKNLATIIPKHDKPTSIGIKVWGTYTTPRSLNKNYTYSFPIKHLSTVKILRGYNKKTHVGHYKYGIDIGLPIGTPVYAARSGVVVYAFDKSSYVCDAAKTQTPDNCSKYGNTLRIRHDDGTVAGYGHLKLNSIRPKIGDRVEEGDLVAYSSNTGTVVPHLHFHIVTYDPSSLIGQSTIPINFRLKNSVISDFKTGQTIELGMP